MIHVVKGFSVVSEAEVDVFLEFSYFSYDPTDVGNLISGFSAFSNSSLYIQTFSVCELLKPSLENFEHFLLVCEMSKIVWFFEHFLGLEWKLTFSSLWPLLSFPNLLAYWVQHFDSIIF